jgi:S-adenosylmethionine hydrolase
MPIITLTTDFGLAGSYVAQIKGVMLAIDPAATLVDINHHIQPQNIRQGAIALAAAAKYFPPGTIHIAVVDPGVGTARRIVYAELGDQRFIAPDNGILSLVARDVPPRRLIALTPSEFWREPVSHTFHGRDIMAPVAAYLSLGLDPARLGEAIDTLEAITWPQPSREGDIITGEVLDIDSYGNVITNIREDLMDVAAPEHIEIRIAGHTIVGLSKTYGDASPGALIALIGSSGYLEIAEVAGNAARRLSAVVGDAITVTVAR